MADRLSIVPTFPRIIYEVIEDPRHVRLTLDGIMIERHADGSVQIFADPHLYAITMRQGRGDGASGPLKSLVVISPLISQPPAAAPTVIVPPLDASPKPDSNPLAPRRSSMWDDLNRSPIPGAPPQIHVKNSDQLKGPE